MDLLKTCPLGLNSIDPSPKKSGGKTRFSGVDRQS